MTGSERPWRLLLDPPADAAWNMAVDEALLETYLGPAAERAAPTLRLYGWNPAALSLGQGQAAREAHDADYLRRNGIDLVRRSTGGLAVLHETTERTYSVVGSLRGEPFRCGVLETYRSIARALELGLRSMGVAARNSRPDRAAAASERPAGPSCYELISAHEITVGGRKLVGSAQLRRGPAFLQHGSIPLHADPERLGRALGREVVAASFTDLTGALEREVSFDEIDRALCEAFEGCFNTILESGTLTPREGLRAAQLRCWKHDSVSWVLRGRLGEREQRWGPVSASISPAR